MKQTFLRLDTLIDVSGSCQKIKCPWDVWSLDRDCCFRTKNRFIFQTFTTNLLDLKRKNPKQNYCLNFQYQHLSCLVVCPFLDIFHLLYFDTISHHFLLTRYKSLYKGNILLDCVRCIENKTGECSHLFSSNDIFNLM